MPGTVYNVTYRTGVVLLPVHSLRYDPATHSFVSYEAVPGRTLTQAEYRAMRSSGELAALEAEGRAIRERDFAVTSRALMPARKPFWRFW